MQCTFYHILYVVCVRVCVQRQYTQCPDLTFLWVGQVVCLPTCNRKFHAFEQGGKVAIMETCH